MSSDTQLQTIEILKQDLTQRDLEIRALRLAMEKLKLELTHLRRMRYGRSNEKMDATQSQLELLSAALAPLVPASGLGEDTKNAASGSNVADFEGERKKRRAKSAKPAQPGLTLPLKNVLHS